MGFRMRHVDDRFRMATSVGNAPVVATVNADADGVRVVALVHRRKDGSLSGDLLPGLTRRAYRGRAGSTRCHVILATLDQEAADDYSETLAGYLAQYDLDDDVGEELDN